MKNVSLLALLGIFLLSSCAVIRPGEVGIKQTLGKFSKEVKTQGTVIRIRIGIGTERKLKFKLQAELNLLTKR